MCTSAQNRIAIDMRFKIINIIITMTKKNVRKEGNVLFNDALNTFYLRLYGVRHMVNDHSARERERVRERERERE